MVGGIWTAMLNLLGMGGGPVEGATPPATEPRVLPSARWAEPDRAAAWAEPDRRAVWGV